MKDCVLATINSIGKIRPFTETKVLFPGYYNLECLLEGAVKIAEFNSSYPEMLLFEPDDKEYVRKVISIAKKASNVVKMLPIIVESSTSTKAPLFTYVIYTDDKMYLNAVMYKYIEVKMMKKSIVKEIITPFAYIFGMIFNYDEADIRGFYLRHYLLYEPSPELEKAFEKLEEGSDPYTLIDSHYDQRYEYVSKKDGFKEFDKWFNTYKTAALKEFKRITNSKDFKNYAKKHVADVFYYHYDQRKMLPEGVADPDDANDD